MSPLSAKPDPARPSPADLPTLDPRPLAIWQAQVTAPYSVRDLVDEFRDDMVTQLAMTERAIATGDADACAFAAHRLKSSCNAVGAFRLASLFEEMELLAKHGAMTFLAMQCALIKAEHAQLAVALQSMQW